MKSKLKESISSLDPTILGVKKINISSFKKLGIGEGNLNYIFSINDKKFICRINIDKSMPNKSKQEFNALKEIEHLNLAPKALYYYPKNKQFPYGFIILEYIEGKAWRRRKRTYTKNQIFKLAKTLGNLHSAKHKGKRVEFEYKDYFISIREHSKEVNKYTGDKLNPLLKDVTRIIKENIPKSDSHNFSLVHDDLCPQNIVERKGKLYLIDWESLKYSDPAKDISRLIIDFHFNKQNMSLFMKEYNKFNSDKDILRRAKIYSLLYRYIYFLWEIVRAYEIKNKELPKEYLNQTSFEEHINEAKRQYRQLHKLVGVPSLPHL